MQNQKNRAQKRPQQAQGLPLGLPTREQILEFIQSADGPADKREIAKAFGLKGNEKIALKALLKDMVEEGRIDGKKTAYHRMGGVPKVTVLKVVAIEDGEAIARARELGGGGRGPATDAGREEGSRRAETRRPGAGAHRGRAQGLARFPDEEAARAHRGADGRGRNRPGRQGMARAGRQAGAPPPRPSPTSARPRRGSWCWPSGSASPSGRA